MLVSRGALYRLKVSQVGIVPAYILLWLVLLFFYIIGGYYE